MLRKKFHASEVKEKKVKRPWFSNLALDGTISFSECPELTVEKAVVRKIIRYEKGDYQYVVLTTKRSTFDTLSTYLDKINDHFEGLSLYSVLFEDIVEFSVRFKDEGKFKEGDTLNLYLSFKGIRNAKGFFRGVLEAIDIEKI